MKKLVGWLLQFDKRWRVKRLRKERRSQADIEIRKGRRPRRPQGLRARFFLLITIPLFVAQAGFIAFFYSRLHEELTLRSASILATEVRRTLQLIETAPDDESRLGILARTNASPWLDVYFLGSEFGSPLPSASHEKPVWRSYFSVGEKLRVALEGGIGGRDLTIMRSPNNKELWLRFRTAGDSLVEVRTPRKRLLSSTWHTLVVSVLLLSVVLWVFALLFMHNQVRSLRSLADAANALGRNDPEVQPANPSGALEVRVAMASFNRMLTRLSRQRSRRRRFLEGIGYDLHATASRIRVLATAPSLEGKRRSLTQEAEGLESLVKHYLSSLRESEGEKPQRVLWSKLLSDLLDETSSRRPEISRSFLCAPDLASDVRRVATLRCFRNLLDSVLKSTNSSLQISARPATWENQLNSVDIYIEADNAKLGDDRKEVQPKDIPQENQRSFAVARDLLADQGGKLLLWDSGGAVPVVHVQFPIALPSAKKQG